jgi:hypothetical protein
MGVDHLSIRVERKKADNRGLSPFSDNDQLMPPYKPIK